MTPVKREELRRIVFVVAAAAAARGLLCVVGGQREKWPWEGGSEGSEDAIEREVPSMRSAKEKISDFFYPHPLLSFLSVSEFERPPIDHSMKYPSLLIINLLDGISVLNLDLVVKPSSLTGLSKTHHSHPPQRIVAFWQ